MSTYGDKVLCHPDKDEIMSRLLGGEAVLACADWLKVKYPGNRRRWISYLTLQRYRQEHLKLQGQVLKDIQSSKRELTTERVHEQREVALRESPAYEAAKMEVVKDILNRDTLILDLKDKIFERIRLLENEDVNYKNDSVIVEYISQLRQLMVDYHKMVVDM